MGSRSKLMSKRNVQVVPTTMVKLSDGSIAPYGKLLREFYNAGNSGQFQLPVGSKTYVKNKVLIHKA